MKISRQLHLWIGLLCSILILVESITGLLLSEPWLMGVEGREGMRAVQTESSNTIAEQRPSENRESGRTMLQGEGRTQPGGLMMFVRQLHEGRIGSMDAKWLVDLSAVAMIFLTITGITLSIKTLRAQRIRRKKQQNGKLEPEIN